MEKKSNKTRASKHILMICLLLLSLLNAYSAYRTGASTQSCGLNLELMLPHSDYSTQAEVIISISQGGNIVSNYIPGGTYHIRISSSYYFNGFIVGANPSTGTGGGGDIQSSQGKILNCVGLSSHITNINMSNLTNLEATWTAPLSTQGEIQIQAGLMFGLINSTLATLKISPYLGNHFRNSFPSISPSLNSNKNYVVANPLVFPLQNLTENNIITNTYSSSEGVFTVLWEPINQDLLSLTIWCECDGWISIGLLANKGQKAHVNTNVITMAMDKITQQVIIQQGKSTSLSEPIYVSNYSNLTITSFSIDSPYAIVTFTTPFKIGPVNITNSSAFTFAFSSSSIDFSSPHSSNASTWYFSADMFSKRNVANGSANTNVSSFPSAVNNNIGGLTGTDILLIVLGSSLLLAVFVKYITKNKVTLCACEAFSTKEIEKIDIRLN